MYSPSRRAWCATVLARKCAMEIRIPARTRDTSIPSGLCGIFSISLRRAVAISIRGWHTRIVRQRRPVRLSLPIIAARNCGAHPLWVNRVVFACRPFTSGLTRRTNIVRLLRHVGLVPRHKVAALQPAARGQEPRGRKPAERTMLASLRAPS
jgi:hypothetical protein